ncbi:hypothetical protein [Chondromyces crocatus]|uniref:Uncharacterized protein n=1 Tax=Chondromyces crocatus TaxID=52 RepID=A0A0K1EBK8_CHOCO|nr:hypothetical protein [Chondromyces crocatus]AKT38250.1 uncharacterized protein CMC5_023930 [Chondromyces crocatus]
MTLFASINGLRVTGIKVRFPYTGVWFADIDLDDEVALLGPVVVRLGRLELRGSVLPALSGGFELASRYCIVGGTGGWMKHVGPLHFHNDAKVKRSTVLLAVARAAGETIDIRTDLEDRMVADFVLQTGPASRILRQLLGTTPWWVRFDGVTQVGPREPREVTEPYDLLNFDPRGKIATLAADDPSAIGVGSVLRARLRTPLVVRQVELELTGGTLRITAWCREGSGEASTEERTLRTLRALVRESLPEYTFLGRYRYRVVRHVQHRLDLQVVRKRSGLPDILLVPIHPGMAGLSAELTPGAIVLVEFVEGDPRLPIVTHFSAEDEPGFLPVELALDATNAVRLGAVASTVELGSGAASVVRHGDTIALRDPVTQQLLLAGLVQLTAGTAEVPPAISKVKA